MKNKIKHIKSHFPINCILISIIVSLICTLIITIIDTDKVNKKLIEAKNTILEIKNEQQNKTKINIFNSYDLSDVEYSRHIIRDVTITSYNNHPSQTDDTPNITSTNRPVREGIVAVSHDLLSKGIIKYGDLVYVKCMDKWYIAEDSMNKRFEKRIDIFLFDRKESLKINKKCDIEVIHYNK